MHEHSVALISCCFPTVPLPKHATYYLCMRTVTAMARRNLANSNLHHSCPLRDMAWPSKDALPPSRHIKSPSMHIPRTGRRGKRLNILNTPHLVRHRRLNISVRARSEQRYPACSESECNILQPAHTGHIFRNITSAGVIRLISLAIRYHL